MIKKTYILMGISLFSAPDLLSMTTIDGDSGSATGSTITLQTGAATYASGTANFAGDNATTITLSFTDAYGNVGLGTPTLSSSISGNYNIALGNNCGPFLTSASNNVMIGQGCGGSLTNGSGNVIIGYAAGSEYTSSESFNTLINDTGIAGDSQLIRIATDATACYIGGIAGISITPANRNFVTVDTTTGQLGSATSIVNQNQPAFFAYTSSPDYYQPGVTGDGTVYTVIFDTELFDQDDNYGYNYTTFTAPVAGIYQFKTAVNLSGLDYHSTASLDLVTNSQTYRLAAETLPYSPTSITLAGGVIIQMQAGDTATVAVTVNLASDTPSVNVNGSNGPIVTYFSGTLLT